MKFLVETNEHETKKRMFDRLIVETDLPRKNKKNVQNPCYSQNVVYLIQLTPTLHSKRLENKTC